MELLKTWKKEKTTLKLFYRGTEKLGYKLTEGKEVIFEGVDFRPSPMHSIDSIEAIRSLLRFLTLQKGSTDEEYFKDYTEKQWQWVNSQTADNIRLYLYDYDN